MGRQTTNRLKKVTMYYKLNQPLPHQNPPWPRMCSCCPYLTGSSSASGKETHAGNWNTECKLHSKVEPLNQAGPSTWTSCTVSNLFPFIDHCLLANTPITFNEHSFQNGVWFCRGPLYKILGIYGITHLNNVMQRKKLITVNGEKELCRMVIA